MKYQRIQVFLVPVCALLLLLPATLPKDAVWGAGAGDQLLLVIPSLNLVMVRFGETLAPGPDEPPIRKDDVFTQ